AVGVKFARANVQGRGPAVAVPARRRILYLEIVQGDFFEQVGNQLTLLRSPGLLAELVDQVSRAQVGRALEPKLRIEPRQRPVDCILPKPSLDAIPHT